MNNRTRFVLYCVLFAFPIAATAAGSESPRPQTREFVKDSELFYAGKFDELEQRARKYRAEGTTSSDGQYPLVMIYEAASTCNCSEMEPPQLWALRKKLITQWQVKYPKSSAAKIAMAFYEKSYAWNARGGGLAYAVSDEGWKLFRERLAHTRRYLESLDADTKMDPGWFVAMLGVGLGEGWPDDEVEALFQRGIHAYPTFYPIYYARSTFLLDQWGGTKERMDAFIDRSVEYTRKQLGESMYTRLRLHTQQINLTPQGGQWPRMKLGFDRITADYPDPWVINAYGRYACLAQDYPTFLAVSRKVGDNFVPEAWENDLYPHCQQMAQMNIRNTAMYAGGSSRQLIPKSAQDGDWKPADKFNGGLLYASAKEDAADGLNRDALAKLAYLEHYGPTNDRIFWNGNSQSFWKTWAALANNYSPAKTKLIAVRDAHIAKAKSGDPFSWMEFGEIAAINIATGDLRNTIDVWTAAKEKNIRIAGMAVDSVLPTIIALKEYKLLDGLIDGDSRADIAAKAHQNGAENAEKNLDQRFRDRFRKQNDDAYSSTMLQLIALLAVNGHKDQALRIRDAALKELPSPEFAAAMVEAVQGKVPQPVL